MISNKKKLLIIEQILLVRTPGIERAVRHARMAHKATKWPFIKILTGPVMRPNRTKLVKYKLFCEKDFNL